MQKGLRQFSSESPISYCFDSSTSPLIKITTSGEISYYNTKNDKLTALQNRQSGDMFIIAWGGKWKTDVFEVTESDILNLLHK